MTGSFVFISASAQNHNKTHTFLHFLICFLKDINTWSPLLQFYTKMFPPCFWHSNFGYASQLHQQEKFICTIMCKLRNRYSVQHNLQLRRIPFSFCTESRQKRHQLNVNKVKLFDKCNLINDRVSQRTLYAQCFNHNFPQLMFPAKFPHLFQIYYNQL